MACHPGRIAIEMQAEDPATGPRHEAPAQPNVGARVRTTVLQAALAGLMVSGMRASLVVLRAMSGGAAISETRWRAAAQAWVDAALPAMGTALLLSLLARKHRALGILAFAATVALGYLLATYQLPAGESVYTPTRGSARGDQVHLAALVVAALAGVLVCLRPRSWLAAIGTIGVATLVLLGTWSTWSRPDPARWSDRPNLILISLDTVRADHLGCYGYPLDTSPHLDAFAADAMRFDRAYTSDIWTLTSHMSMLTGLPPNVHRVDKDRGLSYKAATLPLMLRGEGYSTYAVVDNCAWLHQDYGFNRGFDIYRPVEEPAPAKISQALQLMDEADGAPFFLFLHFYDAHSDWRALPYESEPEDQELLAGWYQGSWQGCDEERAECASTLLQSMNVRGEVLPDLEARFVASLYDAGIRTLDRDLQVLWDGLERRGLLENSVVVITADHGEEFFEYGKSLHTLHQQGTVQVPLIVRTPNTVGGQVTDALTSQLDIAPTLMGMLGKTMPDTQWGHDLAEVLDGSAGIDREWVASGKRGIVQSLRGPRWGIMRRDGEWWADGPDGLIPLAEAPPEAQDLVPLAKSVQESLRTAGDAYPAGPGVGLSDKQKADLAGFGYTGDD